MSALLVHGATATKCHVVQGIALLPNPCQQRKAQDREGDRRQQNNLRQTRGGKFACNLEPLFKSVSWVGPFIGKSEWISKNLARVDSEQLLRFQTSATDRKRARMLFFTIQTRDGKQKQCSRNQLHLILSFIGVKHTHSQQLADYISTHGLLHERTIALDDFILLLQTLLIEFHYTRQPQDIEIAWRIVSRQQSVCILLGGTSGCGKSTLASLLAQRIGITTVLSTDHIRSLQRSFDPQKKFKVLWASSYHAGEDSQQNGVPEQAVIDGYESQCQLMLDTLDKTVAGFYQRNESLVIEGVGLSIENMRTLAKKYPNCIPMVIYISNEQKHAERFVVRAKYMTAAPRANKYIRYFGNIRLIQRHLCKEAEEWMVPKLDNTNVDRSLAILHTTVTNVLFRMHTFNQTSTIDVESGKPAIVHGEFALVCQTTWSSKQMLRRIRQHSLRARSKNSTGDEDTPLVTCGQDNDKPMGRLSHIAEKNAV